MAEGRPSKKSPSHRKKGTYFRHGRYIPLAGWCQVGVKRPWSSAGALLYSQRFTCKLAENESGGTQIRTGDTMIFSHVLYQLSYPAGEDRGKILRY